LKDPTMVKSHAKSSVPTGQVKDWFLPAIESSGSVGHCLDAVISELRTRSAFVGAVKSCLVGRDGKGQDLLTHLAQKVKILGQTLDFRLGILAPDRPQAWFRPPAATSSGPFASALLPEPVFSGEEIWNVENLVSEIATAWESKSISSLTQVGDGPSLWRTLLTLNSELEGICTLPEPYSGFRLDILPDGLTLPLESRPLRAFLLNVRQEIISVREKLDDCKKRLWAASEPFWEAQKKSQASQRFRSRVYGSGGAASAERAREEFRQRRTRTLRAVFLAPADMQAMQFMGFEELPSQTELRQRYLTMAKKLHPDRQDGRDENFKILSSAYERLLARVQADRN
jgi:DnaJ domain